MLFFYAYRNSMSTFHYSLGGVPTCKTENGRGGRDGDSGNSGSRQRGGGASHHGRSCGSFDACERAALFGGKT